LGRSLDGGASLHPKTDSTISPRKHRLDMQTYEPRAPGDGPTAVFHGVRAGGAGRYGASFGYDKGGVPSTFESLSAGAADVLFRADAFCDKTCKP
jgi:hypothetical protein